MSRSEQNPGSPVPGFYIAHHRWLDAEAGPGALHKVGHSGDLRRRLSDSSYVTCFAPGWAFVFAIETASKRDAHRLEAGVLLCAQARRIAHTSGALTELVCLGQAELVALAEQVAGALGIQGRARISPRYLPRRNRTSAASESRAPLPADATAVLSKPARRRLLALRAAPAEFATDGGHAVDSGGADADVSEYISRLLADAVGPADVAEPADVVVESVAEPADVVVEPADVAEPVAEPADVVVEPVDVVGPADEPVVGPADIFADTLLGEAAILQGDAADRKDSGQPAVPRFEDRSYQIEAIAACLAELAAQRRAVLQMACRCGKTRVAHGVICEYLGSPAHRGRPARASRVLFLVPGLALMRQTARKLDRYGFGALGVRLLLVGSDTRPLQGLRCLRAAAPGRGSEDSRTLAGTTNRDLIAAVCGATEPRAALLVIATYQSSPLLPDVFDLTVFDECHRICGARGLRPFNHVLLRHSAGARLFMTATPRLDAPLSMRDRELFGGVAYAYHMRQGIDAGFVNDFSLELVGRAAAGDPPPGKSSSAATRAAKLGTPSQIAAAHDVLAADTPAAKLLVFCRSIRHATGLCRETAALFSARARREGAPRDPRTAAPRCLCAHSRMPRGGVAASLSSFCAPGAPAILFNCRLFQEGVEIPPLNGVFFAAPRHSPRDIIQSLCRPLNAAPGKPASRIFIPVALEPGVPPDAPVNLQRFASIIPYFDALVAEDPLLYEHVLDPRGTPYPLRWVDSAVAARPSGARLRYEPRQLLAAARRSVRRGGAGKTERLLKAARIPWAIGFAELRRIVEECGRYPKTTDCFVYGDAKVNFGQFYRYVRDSYAKWERGEATPLEPHQLRALEALPGWEPYGLQGPYPWAETLSFLEAWLRDHGGVPPMVEINKGGYVGLEATPMERLSGTLTCVNQSDGRDRKSRARAKNGRAARRPGSGLTLDPAKQRDLDALCSRWGLRWRKERHPLPGASAGAPGAGSLVEDEKGAYAGARTFIQEAHARFKQEWARSRRSGAPSAYIARWYPGYPTKHQRQERPDVWARRKEVVPPRWRGRGVAAKTPFDARMSIYF